MNILVTGGAGYIGSHAVLRLLEDGHAVTVVDNLSRGHRAAIDILRPLGDLHFAEGDVGDRALLVDLLRRRSIDVVMHFAAMAYVGESMEMPLAYYRRNTADTLALVEAIDDADVARVIFSSSCATYGEPAPEHIPIGEDCPQQPINPYGRSKLHGEHILTDYAQTKQRRGDEFAITALRYFNVAGCDRAGRIGEDHRPETHLIPICLEVALGQRDAITVFGTDYDTPDGTCIRDYVHVEDLIDAHVAAMKALKPGQGAAYNVGIGRGYSVREVIDATRRVTGIDFAEVEGARREGDPPRLFADPARIHRELGWRAEYTDLEKIIETAWHWKRDHRRGYGP
ncbi:MAG: UDP-glucose 4-epimerase GalE [Planctomycetota bacterium]|nr:UDP-glucose 4-epimerase GalE [Planctomycetota bacterium]